MAKDKSEFSHYRRSAAQAVREGDIRNEIRMRRALVAMDPENARSLFQLGESYLYHGHREEAHDCILSLRSLSGGQNLARSLEVDALIETESYDRLSQRMEEWLVTLPIDSDLIFLFLKAWQNCGKDIFLEKVAELCKTPEGGWVGSSIGLTYHLINVDDVKLPAGSVSASDSELSSMQSLLEAFIDHGRSELAITNAGAVRDSLSTFPEKKEAISYFLEETIALGEGLPSEAARLRPLIQDDFFKDLIISEPGETGKLAFVFTGLNGRALIGNRILDAHLVKLGYQSVFLRDKGRAGFGNGIESLGDSRNETISAMQRICAERNCSDPLIIGASIGTFGAISHGIPMGAKRFALFGPVTAAGDKGFLHRLGDLRGPALLSRATRTIPRGQRLMQDFFDSAPKDIDVRVVVNELDDLDCRYAETIESNKGVRTIKVPKGRSHNSLRSALAQGMFESIIAADI